MFIFIINTIEIVTSRYLRGNRGERPRHLEDISIVASIAKFFGFILTSTASTL